ncbi:crossover junction endodeoxyribonuclease RuvC, partial [Patescibacteria group bacterium]
MKVIFGSSGKGTRAPILSITVLVEKIRKDINLFYTMSHIILGIDPGIADTGFGLIKKEKDKLSCIDYGSIKTKAKVEMPERLE